MPASALDRWEAERGLPLPPALREAWRMDSGGPTFLRAVRLGDETVPVFFPRGPEFVTDATSTQRDGLELLADWMDGQGIDPDAATELAPERVALLNGPTHWAVLALAWSASTPEPEVLVLQPDPDAAIGLRVAGRYPDWAALERALVEDDEADFLALIAVVDADDETVRDGVEAAFEDDGLASTDALGGRGEWVRNGQDDGRCWVPELPEEAVLVVLELEEDDPADRDHPEIGSALDETLATIAGPGRARWLFKSPPPARKQLAPPTERPIAPAKSLEGLPVIDVHEHGPVFLPSGAHPFGVGKPASIAAWKRARASEGLVVLRHGDCPIATVARIVRSTDVPGGIAGLIQVSHRVRLGETHTVDGADQAMVEPIEETATGAVAASLLEAARAYYAASSDPLARDVHQLLSLDGVPLSALVDQACHHAPHSDRSDQLRMLATVDVEERAAYAARFYARD